MPHIIPRIRRPWFIFLATTTMINSSNIITLIQEDAPCVYDILHELCFPNIRSSSYPHSDSGFTWDNFFISNPEVVRPTADQLLDILKEYSGDNHDVHYWSGRYAQMIEDYRNQEPIRVPFTESDINDLQEWEYFTWTYWGRQLFIFNTDSTPQFDPDSDEYDPTLTV